MWGEEMKKTLLVLVVVWLAAVAGAAQSPVSDAAREMLAQHAKNLPGAAEEMPADKYGYKPTPEQHSFGSIVLHTVRMNYGVCAKIAGVEAPKAPELKDTDAKEKLAAALKASFDFCTQSWAKLDDSKLAEKITVWKEPVTRAAAIVDVSGDWAGHYTQMAGYLRLNGLLPPTAKKK